MNKFIEESDPKSKQLIKFKIKYLKEEIDNSDDSARKEKLNKEIDKLETRLGSMEYIKRPNLSDSEKKRVDYFQN